MLWPSQSKVCPGVSDDKASACNEAEPVWYLGLEDPQEKEMVGYSPWGHKESAEILGKNKCAYLNVHVSEVPIMWVCM